MTTETFIIGNREFTATRMNAFDANLILLKIQKIVLPIFGSIKGQEGKITDLMDMDLKEAADILSENLNEETFDKIVFPMFRSSRVYCLSDNNDQAREIKGKTEIDLCFTSENLFDLYELIWEVARFNFSPFFEQVADRFGLNQVPNQQKQTNGAGKKKEKANTAS